eukprot:TRINITY_DN24754_c0_g1_i1.p1 TRINITY_DN24754_c0_g1~~TRINITY_DN24754_c0_g1_i1.p1  ORF type:complete len:198 (-),score=37.86 TRINITY_DN24754_c0_g1_i1:1-594(-)
MLCTQFFFFLMIRRPPRSTHCISSAASDVYKRQEKISAVEFNKLMQGYDNMYWQVWQAGYYLPELKQARNSLHTDYYLQLINKQILSVTRNELKEPIRMVKQVSSSLIYDEISKSTHMELGLDPLHLPPQECLLKLLWKVNSDHSLFKMSEEEVQEEEQPVLINKAFLEQMYGQCNYQPSQSKGCLLYTSTSPRDQA